MCNAMSEVVYSRELFWHCHHSNVGNLKRMKAAIASINYSLCFQCVTPISQPLPAWSSQLDSREGNGSAFKTLPSHTIPPVTQANSWYRFQRTEREQLENMVLGYLCRSHFEDLIYSIIKFLMSVVKFQAFLLATLHRLSANNPSFSPYKETGCQVRCEVVLAKDIQRRL